MKKKVQSTTKWRLKIKVNCKEPDKAAKAWGEATAPTNSRWCTKLMEEDSGEVLRGSKISTKGYIIRSSDLSPEWKESYYINTDSKKTIRNGQMKRGYFQFNWTLSFQEKYWAVIEAIPFLLPQDPLGHCKQALKYFLFLNSSSTASPSKSQFSVSFIIKKMFQNNKCPELF